MLTSVSLQTPLLSIHILAIKKDWWMRWFSFFLRSLARVGGAWQCARVQPGLSGPDPATIRSNLLNEPRGSHRTHLYRFTLRGPPAPIADCRIRKRPFRRPSRPLPAIIPLRARAYETTNHRGRARPFRVFWTLVRWCVVNE